MGLFLDETQPAVMGICAPYAPLRTRTPAIRTLNVFVGSVAMNFAPKLAKIGAVVAWNDLFTL